MKTSLAAMRDYHKDTKDTKVHKEL
jgi:hypothetical protein